MKSNNQIIINQIINPHFNSNTYFINKSENDSFIIIDPGDLDLKSLSVFLSNKSLKICNVILTHEHYDHICGLKSLSSLFDINLFLSSYCYKNINNPKKNLSDYLDVEILNDLSPKNIFIVSDNETINISNFMFKFYYTPGHSEGSICIGFNKVIFTGDSLLKDYKTITSLPGGNKNDYKNTKDKIHKILDEYETVYPGHGSIFPIKLVI